MAVERYSDISAVAFQITIEELKEVDSGTYSGFLRRFINADGDEKERKAAEADLDDRIFELRSTEKLISDYSARNEAWKLIEASKKTP